MLLIIDANLISPDGCRKADILIEGERIIAVADAGADAALRARATHVVDAAGLLAFPGLIDVHTHLREPGGEHKEDFHSGTSAALAGGVTTVFGMPNTQPALTDAAALDMALARAAASAVCDFGLFLGATNTNAGLKMAAPEMHECGLKMYMGSSTGDLLVEDFGLQLAHFEQYPRERVIAVHAEHEQAVRAFAARRLRRPPVCAEIETGRAIALAEATGHRLHICHVSTRRELEQIVAARARGVPVTCEVAPHHLFFTTGGRWLWDDVPRPVAAPDSFFEMNPPLREADDARFLWNNLAQFDCIATDHAPHTLAEKHSARPPMGLPGLEDMLPLLLTAVHAGRLRLEDIARLCCDGPARTFSIARKGTIMPGYDADITLVDAAREHELGAGRIYSKCGWSAFAGFRARGAVHSVYVRGSVAFDDGMIVAQPGSGRRIEQAHRA
ncbi:MAG: dihydroorotase family protein [Chloroflexi bacterium]|nr:dihydroorotase family protein [Chloroflexota bacterium]